MSAGALPASLDPAREAAIDVQCARQSLKHFGPILVSTLALVALVALLLRERAPTERLAIWTATIGSLLAVRLGIAVLYARRKPADDAIRPWVVAAAVTLPLSSLVWGALVYVPSRPDDPVANTVALLFIGGHLAGASQSLIGTPRTYVAVAVGLLGPPLFFFFTSGVPGHGYLGLTVIVYGTAVSRIAVENHRVMRASIALRFGNLDLVEQLRVEKSRVEAARDEAERAQAAKERFLAAASHDIRQPIHAAQLFVGALERQGSSDGAGLVRGLGDCLGAARHMLDSMLDLSLLDGAAMERTDGPCDAATLAGRLAALLEPVARRRGLRLRTHAPPGLWFRSDPALCQRILMNLVSNAVKYTERGGVLIAFRRRDDRCVVQVWDTGRGIPGEHLETIFEEFSQLDNAARDGSRGIGLGLAIVRRLARLLDTEIRVRSVVGRGSVFTFELPRMEPPTAVPERERDAPRVEAQLSGRLLVVDDNAMIREGLAALLGAWGFDVEVAHDVEAAASAARGPRIDVALVDHRLPDGRSSEHAIEAVHAAQGRQVAAIVITGDTTEVGIEAASRSGHPVLFKPVRPDALRAALESALVAERPGDGSP